MEDMKKVHEEELEQVNGGFGGYEHGIPLPAYPSGTTVYFREHGNEQFVTKNSSILRSDDYSFTLITYEIQSLKGGQTFYNVKEDDLSFNPF